MTLGHDVAVDLECRAGLCRDLEAIVEACRRSCEDVGRILGPFTKGKIRRKLRGFIPPILQFTSWHKHLAEALPTLPERTKPDN